MAWLSRRRFLLLAGAGGLALVAGLRFGTPWVMRSRFREKLGATAAAFAEGCFDGLDRSRIWDSHVHAVGLGAGGSGCEINPEMLSQLHPVKRFQFDVYKSGVGMTREATADADYVARLLDLHDKSNPQGKLVTLAFDRNVAEDGTERPELSPFYTPNDYVLGLADRHPQIVAGASVHPYRRDAIDRLDEAIDRGARALKWLPNAMGIDPASPRCDAFYRRMAEHGTPLITHAGREYAVDAGHGQDLGNPLLLRRALDTGVRVIVAHCASLGSYPDLDAANRPETPAFDLLMRLFADPSYESNLFADISTVAHVHHDLRPLRDLLTSRELHPRLVYGSDYPICALRFMISPRRLVLAGFLTDEQRPLCAEIFDYDPLLFDLVVNRCLQVESNGRVHRFSPEVFHTDRLFRRDDPSVSRPTSPASIVSA